MTMQQLGKLPEKFNPFEDRLSRDICNELSLKRGLIRQVSVLKIRYEANFRRS